MIKIILNKGKEQSLKRFHPWVFSGAVKKIQGGEPAEGDVVEVYSSTGEYLGCGHYQIYYSGDEDCYARNQGECQVAYGRIDENKHSNGQHYYSKQECKPPIFETAVVFVGKIN